MSRNLYLGADLLPLAIYGKDPAQTTNFSKTVSWVWGNVQKTNWNVRVRGLARELKQKRPDLVGLQEAALWQKSRTANGVPNQPVYDFLKSLIAEARRQGVTYRLLAVQDEFDFTVPSSLGYRLRFIQRDAVLIRTNSPLRPGKIYKGRYSETFKVDTPVGVADSRRGWIAVDLRTKGGKLFRFLNTHLEAYGDGIRAAQAAQLMQTGARTSLPLVMVGDMNSDPRSTGAAGDAFRALQTGGLTSVFSAPVATSGQDDMLRNNPSQLQDWIDHILVRGSGWKTLSTGVVGNQTSEMIGGLWPSDHAGVLARLRLG